MTTSCEGLLGALVTYSDPETGAGETLNVSLNFSCIRAIKDEGYALTGTPSFKVLKDGVATTAFTVQAAGLDTTNTKAQVRLTNVSADSPGVYLLVCSVNLTNGDNRIVGLDIEVEPAQGGLLTRC